MTSRRFQRVVAMAALVIAGSLLAGCQDSATPTTTLSGARTVATVSKSQSTSPTTAAGRNGVKKATALPECGALRDPFDPNDTPPPAGSPARC